MLVMIDKKKTAKFSWWLSKLMLSGPTHKFRRSSRGDMWPLHMSWHVNQVSVSLSSEASATFHCWLGLGRYRCGARYPILSAPDDTDTGSDVIALYADWLMNWARFSFLAKALEHSVLHHCLIRTIRQCINMDEWNTRVSKRQCIAEVWLPNVIGHGDLIWRFADEWTLLDKLINEQLFSAPTINSPIDAPAIGHTAGGTSDGR
jgi:hypothetical protein